MPSGPTADLIELLEIPDDYQLLFLQGGATMQFAMVPMNLLADRTSADYVNTGAWSKKAIAEAGRFCSVNVVASAEDRNFSLYSRRRWLVAQSRCRLSAHLLQ